MASAADLYTVKGVHVDVTAASATEARSIAQAQGQSEALTDLMRRLTLASDWSRLPKAEASTVQDAVRGFQVAGEKASSTRYIADLNVSFRPDAVRGMLKRAGILYGETQAKPALLVPVYEKGGVKTLWEDANPWREALSKRDLDNAMTPLLLPIGDVQEFSLLTASQAVSGDKTAIANLGQRYGADDVVVATAQSNAAGSSIRLIITRYGLGDAAPIQRTYQSLDDAAVGLISVLGDQWKRDTIVAPGSQAHMTATVSYIGLDQWETVRNGLGSTPLVSGLQVDGITSTGAEVEITYRGTPEKLALSLAQANVALTQDEHGWMLQAR
jgi:hypothetical protein